MFQNVPLDFREFLELELAGLQDRLAPRAQQLEKEIQVLQLRLNLVKDRLTAKDVEELEAAWSHEQPEMLHTESRQGIKTESGEDGRHEVAKPIRKKMGRGVSFHHDLDTSRESIAGVFGRKSRATLASIADAQSVIANDLARQGFERTLSQSYTDRQSCIKRKKHGTSIIKRSGTGFNNYGDKESVNRSGTGGGDKKSVLRSNTGFGDEEADGEDARRKSGASVGSLDPVAEGDSELPGLLQRAPQEDSYETLPTAADNGNSRRSTHLGMAVTHIGSVSILTEKNGSTDALPSYGSMDSGKTEYTMPVRPAASLYDLGPSAGTTVWEDDYEMHVFDVLPEWRRAVKPAGKNCLLSRAGTAAMTKIFDADDDNGDPSLTRRSTVLFRRRQSGIDGDREPICNCCMLLPNSLFHFIWDIIGIFFIIFDALWLPLQFFHPPETVFTRTMCWFTRLFWTADIFINFRTAFVNGVGELETRASKVCMRYVKSWLLIDLIVVSADWMEFAVDNGGGGASAGRFVKTFKIARTLRMIRLMRLMKLPGILHHFADEFSNKVRSEKMFLVGGVAKTMASVGVFVHIVGCFWFLVGEADDEDSWILHHEMNNTTIAYQYMTSFHWSLSQLSGTMEVMPQNLGERIFAVCCLFVAWMISASAVSVITTAMTRDSFFNIQGSMESVKLRKYLLEHNISRKLMARVLRNASYAVAERTRNVTEENLELLKLVSEPLRVELHFEVRSPVLSSHPFFRSYKEFNPVAMRRTCHNAVTQVCLSPGDIMFSEGEAPTVPVMYFVVSGTLKYWQGGLSRPKFMRPGDWGAEANLWTSWLHQGFLRASTECNIVALGTKGFCDCDSQYAVASDDGRSHAARYGHDFVSTLNKILDDDGELTDLDSDEVDVHIMCRNIFEEPEEVNPKSTMNRSESMAAAASRFAANRGMSTKSIRQNTTRLSEFFVTKVGTLTRSATQPVSGEDAFSKVGIIPEEGHSPKNDSSAVSRGAAGLSMCREVTEEHEHRHAEELE